MGQNNSRRVSHDIDRSPNIFRDDQLRRIIDDINEEMTGKGYTELFYTGGFVSEVKVWSEPTNNPSPNPNALLRKHEVYTRTNNFVSSISTDYYGEDGVTIVANVLESFVRAANKQVLSIDTVITRP